MLLLCFTVMCLNHARYERSMLLDTSGENKVGVLLGQVSPYSAVDGVPLPEKLLLEPGYIHRRNERERDRVRSLNEGYDRLKQRLPLRIKDKRISKVCVCVALWASGRHLASGSEGLGFESWLCQIDVESLGKSLYMHFLTSLVCKTSTRL